MKTVKKIFKSILYFLLIPLTYLLISLILSSITVNKKITNTTADKTIYLSTNGIHLDIIIPKHQINKSLLETLKHDEATNYIAFGWGDENFYINTPTWNDLTFNNGFSALFLKSTTLMHVTRYSQKEADWIAVSLNSSELNMLNTYISNTFETDKMNNNILLQNKGYSFNDDFYKAKGSYSCLKTCNSWANSAFKKSGLKACLWTPFDFGLINKYK